MLMAPTNITKMAGLLALMAAPAVVWGQSWETQPPNKLQQGSSYPLSWSSGGSQVAVALINRGDGSSLWDIVCNNWINNDTQSACKTDETSIEWNPSDTIPLGTYSLGLISPGGSTTYSSGFELVANGDAPPTSTSTSSTADPTSDPTSSTSSPGTTTTGSGSPSETTAADSSGPGSSTDLTTGAKAGIGVGAAVGGLALLLGLGYLVFRLGKKSAAAKAEKNEDDAEKAEASVPKEPELAGDSTQPVETKDSGMAEMDAPKVVHEAPDYKTRLETPNQFVSELDATGGSFVISRPSSAAGKDAAAGGGTTGSGTEANKPSTPKVIVTDDDGHEQVSPVSPSAELAEASPKSEAATPVTPKKDGDGDGDGDGDVQAAKDPKAAKDSDAPKDGEDASKYPETPDDVGRGKSD